MWKVPKQLSTGLQYDNSVSQLSLVKLVPKYSESIDIEEYLLSFEKAMNLNEVCQGKWSCLLYTLLTRKALWFFSELSLSECKRLSHFKQALLTAF